MPGAMSLVAGAILGAELQYSVAVQGSAVRLEFLRAQCLGGPKPCPRLGGLTSSSGMVLLPISWAQHHRSRYMHALAT